MRLPGLAGQIQRFVAELVAALLTVSAEMNKDKREVCL